LPNANILSVDTNSARLTFSSYGLDPRTGVTSSSSHLITANITTPPDDFILSPSLSARQSPCSAFICFPAAGALGQVDLLTGVTTRIANNLTGPTAVAWGRGLVDRERGSLYVTLSGGVIIPPGLQGLARVDVGNLS
jgi:hypothetical protein